MVRHAFPVHWALSTCIVVAIDSEEDAVSSTIATITNHGMKEFCDILRD